MSKEGREKGGEEARVRSGSYLDLVIDTVIAAGSCRVATQADLEVRYCGRRKTFLVEILYCYP